jgi:hypothetical protein
VDAELVDVVITRVAVPAVNPEALPVRFVPAPEKPTVEDTKPVNAAPPNVTPVTAPVIPLNDATPPSVFAKRALPPVIPIKSFLFVTSYASSPNVNPEGVPAPFFILIVIF